MKIQVLSDLHLETPAAYDIFQIPPSAPYLALLGDIGYVKDVGLTQFLEKQLHNFQIVFFLLGNHEPYHFSWAKARAKLQQLETDVEKRRGNGEAKLGKFVLLDQTRYDLSEKVTILGCTLHSNVTSTQLERVSFGLNDFYRIEDWTVEAHNLAHKADLGWLNAQVVSITEKEPTRDIVIFTHHSPSIDARTVDSRHVNSPISSGFSTDLSKQMCCTSKSVKVWAFGHTHYNCDFTQSDGGPRLLTNQRGYYFAQAAGFQEERVLEL